MKTESSTAVFVLAAVTFATGLIFVPLRAEGQGGIPLWTNRYSDPVTGVAEGKAVAVDSDGNVFVTGSSIGGATHFDYVTIKYSSTGVPLWTNRYDGPESGADEPMSMAVDNSGNVVVTGISDHSGYDSFHTNYDYATIKYSSAGVPLWTNRYNGPGNSMDWATSVAVDGSGNVFVTGASDGHEFQTNYAYATIKYSSAGVPLWTNRYDGPANDSWAEALALDSNGNVFVTGESTGNGGNEDYATIKYSSAGVPLWTNLYNGPGNAQDLATSIAVDSSGNVIVTGGSDRFGDPDFAYFEFATIKYSNTGVPLWTNRFFPPTYVAAFANALAVDGSGNVFVTGGVDRVSPYTRDFATVAYSSAGAPLWTNCYNGPADSEDEPLSIAVDGSGNVFVAGAGYTYSYATNHSDFITVAYSGAGVPLWTNLLGGPPDRWDGADAVAVDGNGNALVTGWSRSNGTNSDFVTIKYSSVSPAAPSLAIRYSTTNTVVISWPSPSTGFQLQQNTNGLGSANWSIVTNTIQDNGTNRFIVVSPLAGTRFFRLIKP